MNTKNTVRALKSAQTVLRGLSFKTDAITESLEAIYRALNELEPGPCGDGCGGTEGDDETLTLAGKPEKVAA